MDLAKSKYDSARRAPKRHVKRALWLLCGATSLGAVVWAALPKPVPVESAEVDRGVVVVTVDEDGVSRVKDRYVVSAPLSGNLARVGLRAGDVVKPGEVLTRILPARAPLLDARSKRQAEAQVARAGAALKQAQAQIERARASRDYATTEAARTRALFRENTISQAELDRALLEQRARDAELTSSEFADKVLAHELSMARAALGRFDDRKHGETEQFEVPSPIGGRVLKVMTQSEGVVQAGAPLVEVGNPEALEVVVDILTNDAVQIRPGSAATLEGWGGKPIKAVVRLIEPSAFTRISALGVEEQRVNAIVDLDAPYADWAQLGDGYRVEAKIEVYRAPAATRVPGGALFRSGERWAVFVIEGMVARLRALELGRRNDVHAEVLTGLSPGERVIVHPNDQVSDGASVAVR
jgi:HlyD family secretion protein